LQTDLLVNRIWSHDTPGDKNLLLNLIYRLRQKLDPRSSPGMHIQRIPGEGYRWKSTRAEDYHSSF
jgi:DNA-binding response OmpR family regulator